MFFWNHPPHRTQAFPIIERKTHVYKKGLEEQLFSRIRDLEAHLAHGLPPQLNPGEYEHLVRGLLENSINVHHYQQVLSQELFDIKMMEMKRDLQNLLLTFMIAEHSNREGWNLFWINLLTPIFARKHMTFSKIKSNG